MMAATIAHSLKTGVDYCIPMKVDNPHYEGQKPYIFKGVNYCNCETLTFDHQYNEPHFHYSEIPNEVSLLLNGYFQSHRYFEEYRNEILKAFDIPYEFNKGYVAIHWRLGDYLTLSKFHPPVTIEYIHAAIKYFTDWGYENFIVFSDNPQYCMERIVVPEGCSIGFSQGRTELEDLSLASSCAHCVGSNSTFSWWIYYLNQNENKIGVFPQKHKWFGQSLPHNVDDLYNEKWYLI